jgi:predicted dehydrogenase
MNSVLNVGVVGCGYWGPNLVRNFRALSGCRVRFVCDHDENRLRHMKSLYPEVETTTELADLIECKSLDAVVVATPVGTHHALALAALQAGKHVFVEKPLARSVAECEDLIRESSRRGLTLMVGHTFLYSPVVRRIKEIVDRGDIGDIRYIASRRLNLGLYQKDINVTWDLAPHDISIILYILEETPLSVNCRGSAHVTPGVEDVTLLNLEFRRQRSAQIHSSWLDPRKVREMTIVGSRRMIVYDDVTPHEKLRIFDTRVETPPHYDTFAEFQYSYHYGDVYAPYIKQEEPLKIECQHFLDCIRTGQEPLSNGRQALEMVRILEAASVSLKNQGAPVSLSAGEEPAPASAKPVNGRGREAVAAGRPHAAKNGSGNGKHHHAAAVAVAVH